MNYQFNWHRSRRVGGDEYEEPTPLDYLAMRNRDALRDWRRRYFASALGKQSIKASTSRSALKQLIVG